MPPNKQKIKAALTPKKHHGFQVVLFLLGCLLPPLAVAARFGLGHDLAINVFLCICGYFPCHIHNFYIQNIRNNTNRARTPKWALKAGLIDNSDKERRDRKNLWSKRFDERNNQSTHIGQALEDGEEGNDYVPVSDADRTAEERRRNEGLWTNEDETYYNEDRAANQENWHYPANFAGTVGDGRSKRQPAKPVAANGDRWERSRASRSDTVTSSSSGNSYPPAAEDDVPEWGRDYGNKRGTGKKTKPSGAISGGRGGWADNGGYAKDVGRDDGRANGNGNAAPKRGGDIFDHEF